MPNHILYSGETDLDAIARDAMHHWLYLRTKSYEAQKKKFLKKRPLSEWTRTDPTIDQAPKNLNQSGNIYSEALIFLRWKSHLALSLNRPDDDDDGDEDSSASAKSCSTPPLESDEEEKKLRPSMKTTSKFKGRSQLRKEALELKKKTISSATKAVAQKAQALQNASISSLCTTRLKALQQAGEMGMTRKKRRSMMTQIMMTLFESDEDDRRKERGEKRVNSPIFLDDSSDDEEEKAAIRAKRKKMQMWDLVDRQALAKSGDTGLYAPFPRRYRYTPYLTPPPTYDQTHRNYVLTQYSDDFSSSAGSSGDERKPAAKPAVKTEPSDEDSEEVQIVETKITKWMNARTCCAEEACKAAGEPFPNTLECPLCGGFVHYQCANFNLPDYIGKPVCAKCAAVKKLLMAQSQMLKDAGEKKKKAGEKKSQAAAKKSQSAAKKKPAH